MHVQTNRGTILYTMSLYFLLLKVVELGLGHNEIHRIFWDFLGFQWFMACHDVMKGLVGRHSTGTIHYWANADLMSATNRPGTETFTGENHELIVRSYDIYIYRVRKTRHFIPAPAIKLMITLTFTMATYYMLKYPLECVPAWTAGTHSSAYLNN